MKTKVLLLCLVLATVGQSIYAQTQQGYVKTLGRPEKKGEALGGVTIRVKGEHNPVISNKDGTFSMLLANKKNGDAYALQQVLKNGFELNESDIIGRQFAFSDKVPLTIVMVSSEQLQTDKQRIENNAYKTAEKNYKAKYNLLEKQLSDNKITTEQYREEIQELQDNFEKYQSLIDGLAEHYVHTDYDNLDEKDRIINICIENGELERADSLIRLLFDPIGVLERNKEALASIEQQISQARGIIAQADEDMVAVLKKQEKDAEYLYQLYTIALARYDNENAQFYIETRAALDTTNVEWLLDAGKFVLNYLTDIEKAEKYYRSALSMATASNNTEQIADCYNDIGYMYSIIGDFEGGVENLNKSIATRKSILDENHISFTDSYSNLGYCYAMLGQFEEALHLFESALSIQQEHYGEQNVNVALSYNNLGMLNLNLGKATEALECFNKALEIQIALLGENSEDVACSYNNIASYYSEMNEPDKAIEYEKKSLNTYQCLFGETHPEVAVSCINLSTYYNEAGDSTNALAYGYRAVDIYTSLFGENNIYVAQCNSNIGVIYEGMKNNEKALEFANKALAIKKDILGEDHESVAKSYNNIGAILDNMERYEEAIAIYSKALPILVAFYGEVHPSVSTIYTNMAYSYEKIGNYEQALTLLNKAITSLPDSHPDLPIIQRKITKVEAKIEQQGNGQKND